MISKRNALRFYFVNLVKYNWPLFQLYRKFSYNKSIGMRLVKKDSQIVIEGFPRSANSYLNRVFKATNPEVRRAHHIHSPFQFRIGYKLGIPLVLIIRKPKEVVQSMQVAYKGINPNEILKKYILFHRMLYPIRKKILIVSFEEVINDSSLVLKRINERFRTSYNTDGSKLSKDHIQLELKRHAVEKTKNELMAGVPTNRKDNLKALIQSFEKEILDKELLAEAQIAYVDFINDIGIDRNA